MKRIHAGWLKWTAVCMVSMVVVGVHSWVNPVDALTESDSIQIHFDETVIESPDHVIKIGSGQTMELSPEFAEFIRQEKEEQRKDPEAGIFHTTLGFFTEEDQVSLEFSLENLTEEEIELAFGSGQMFEIIIRNQEGEPVYTYSNHYAFTMAIQEKSLKGGEKLLFSSQWDYTDDEGNLVPPGNYTVTVTILARFKEDSFFIKKGDTTVLRSRRIAPEDLRAVKWIKISETTENSAVKTRDGLFRETHFLMTGIKAHMREFLEFFSYDVMKK